MKRLFPLLFIFAILGFATFGPGTYLNSTAALQTVTDEVDILPLPVPPNVIGTNVRSVSNDGKRIVFDSINDYNGNNVDSNTEIWVYDVATLSIIQITNTADIPDPNDATKPALHVNNTTPIISGDGTKIVFASNAALGGTKNDDGNYEIYLASLPLGATQATITRITDTGTNTGTEVIKEIFTNYSPTINDDGSVIAFLSTRTSFNAIDGVAPAFAAAKEGANNADPDGNGEIFLYSTATRSYSQVTISRDMDATVNFVVKGFNASPFLSGDGRTLGFLSGFNYPGANANKNADFNGEIFLYKVGDPPNTFTQVTDTTGTAVVPVLQIDGTYAVSTVAPMNVIGAFTHPINRNGTLLTFESAGNFNGANSDKTREVWLYDVTAKSFTPVTSQTASATPTQAELKKLDYNFMPSINSTGTTVAFASVLNLTPASSSSVATDNADGSRDVFRYDIAQKQFRQITFTDLSGTVVDQRNATYRPFADNSGTLLTFSYDASLIAGNSAAIEDVFQALVRPVTAVNATAPMLTNAASFDATQVARGSIVAAFGTQLANTTVSAPGANLPFQLGGVTVTVKGIAARVSFVSPGQVNFAISNSVVAGDSVSFTINNNGVQSKGTVKLVDAAPGVFSVSGDGKGKSAAQCGQVSPDGLSFVTSAPPCSVGNDSQSNILTLYGTGWRNAASVQVTIGDQTFTPSFSGAQPEYPGLDQINVNLTQALAAMSDLTVKVTVASTTNIDSNPTTVSFLPLENSLSVFNAASFDAGTVARGSIAFAQGTNLSNVTATPAGPNYPLTLNGVTLTVAGVAAQLTYISPTQINFIVPNGTKPADLVEVVVNNNGTISRGRVKVLDASPGVLTTTGDGVGVALVQCGKVNPDSSITFTNPPCSVGTAANPNIVRVFGTGWRNADSVSLMIGSVQLTNVFVGGQPASGGGVVPGVDVIDAKLDPSLAGLANQDVIVTTKVGTVTTSTKTGIKITFASN